MDDLGNRDGSYNSGDTNIAEYAYDTQGRRIRVYDAVSDATTLYYYSDNWQVLAEYNGSGVQQAFYVFGNYIDEVLLMHRDTANHYYLHDHLYSPVALLDDTGNVIERYEYDAYGKVQILSSGFSVLSSSQHGNPYYFTGRELDQFDNGNLTLQYNRNRYLSQYMGCWFTSDPLGYVDGLNLYEYVQSEPVNKNDPTGLFWLVGRNGGPKAIAMPFMVPRTIGELAYLIGLNGYEFQDWLTLYGDIRTEQGVRTLKTLSPSDKICPMQRVEIPNTVFTYWAGEN